MLMNTNYTLGVAIDKVYKRTCKTMMQVVMGNNNGVFIDINYHIGTSK